VTPFGFSSTTPQARAVGVSREAKRESACSPRLQLSEDVFRGDAEAGFVFSPALLQHSMQLLALFGVHVRKGIVVVGPEVAQPSLGFGQLRLVEVIEELVELFS
jgi:hypothetical protein